VVIGQPSTLNEVFEMAAPQIYHMQNGLNAGREDELVFQFRPR